MISAPDFMSIGTKSGSSESLFSLSSNISLLSYDTSESTADTCLGFLIELEELVSDEEDNDKWLDRVELGSDDKERTDSLQERLVCALRGFNFKN